MRARNIHKLVTNSNGNEASAIGGLFALIGFVAIVALLVAPFL
jgi:hypothetical protein